MTFTIRPVVVVLASLLGSLLTDAQIPGVTRSFYGMAYSPEGALFPNCGATQAAVTRDMANVAQFTPRIRLYGSDCNQTALVLQGIKEAGDVDLTVWLGIFIDGNDTIYQRQMDAVTDAIKAYGTDHIGGITVGNEYLLLSYGTVDGGTPTDSKGVAARTTLLNYIQKTNQTLQAMKLPKVIPLGTADSGDAVTKELCAGVDFVMANVHAWFGKVPIANAATWTWQFFQDHDIKICAPAPNNPIMYVAETGWPTATDNASSVATLPSGPGLDNLQTFLDTYICPANANGTSYFFFEYKDEIWKKKYGGVEPYWGLFDTNLALKNLKYPNCPVQSPTNRAVVISSSAAINVGGSITPVSGGTTSKSGGKKSDATRQNKMHSVILMSSLLTIIGLVSVL